MNQTQETNHQSENNQTIPLGVLWQKESRKGETYFSGYIKNADGVEQRVVLFKNNFKRADKQDPDLRLFLSKPPEDQSKEDQLAPVQLPF